MRARQVTVLILGLWLSGQVAMPPIEANALSASTIWPNSATHPFTAQLSEGLFQFEAHHAHTDGQVPFFTTRPDTALFIPRPASAMVFAQQSAEIPIEGPAEEFMLSLIFPSSQQDADTQVGHRTMLDSLLNAEPSQARDSMVRMNLKGIHPGPVPNGMEQPSETMNYVIVTAPAR